MTPTQQQWERAARLRGRVRRAVARKVSPKYVDDAVSDAMVEAYRALADTDDELEAWLVRVANRRGIDYWRKDRNRATAEASAAALAPAEPGTSEVVEQRAKAALVAAFVSALPPLQRESLMLRADGLSVVEVASRLDTTPSAVQSALSRARSTVRAAVEQAWSLPPLVAARCVVRWRPRRAAWVALAAATGIWLLAPMMPWRTSPRSATEAVSRPQTSRRPSLPGAPTTRPLPAPAALAPSPATMPESPWRPLSATPSPTLRPNLVLPANQPHAPRQNPEEPISETIAKCASAVVGALPDADVSCLVSPSPSPSPTPKAPAA